MTDQNFPFRLTVEHALICILWDWITCVINFSFHTFVITLTRITWTQTNEANQIWRLHTNTNYVMVQNSQDILYGINRSQGLHVGSPLLCGRLKKTFFYPYQNYFDLMPYLKRTKQHHDLQMPHTPSSTGSARSLLKLPRISEDACWKRSVFRLSTCMVMFYPISANVSSFFFADVVQLFKSSNNILNTFSPIPPKLENIY